MIEETLLRLSTDLESDGYLIGLTRDGDRYWLNMPDHDVPDECALVRFNIPKHENPELRTLTTPQHPPAPGLGTAPRHRKRAPSRA